MSICPLKYYCHEKNLQNNLSVEGNANFVKKKLLVARGDVVKY